MSNLMIALRIMGMGMLGIFVSILIIMIIISLIGKISAKTKKPDKE